MPEKPNKREFLSRFDAVVDCQRRLAIPKQWRFDSDPEDLSFFLTVGVGPSLELFEYAEYEKRQASLAAGRGTADYEFLATASSMYSTMVKLDKQGRITIPQHMLDAAMIKTKVLCIGSSAFGSIYAPEVWAVRDPGIQKVIDFNLAFRRPTTTITQSETKILMTTDTQ